MMYSNEIYTRAENHYLVESQACTNPLPSVTAPPLAEPPTLEYDANTRSVASSSMGFKVFGTEVPEADEEADG